MTAIGRISTYAVFSNTLRDVNKTQSSLYDLQDQISSGLKTRSFEGLNGQVEQFVQLEARIKKATAYQQNNEVSISRLQTTKVALDQITEIADQMENYMVLRNNSSFAETINFEQQIKAQLETIASQLNTSFEGRFIFGGTKTNVPPVITDPTIPEPVEVGVLDAGYYQGSKENIELRADDNVLITANVRADDEAFQRFFGAAALAIEAHNESDFEKLEDAIDLIQQGQEQLNAIQATLDTDILTLENTNERHEQLTLYWKGVTQQVSKTDILAASTQLSVDQAVLQATFQAFAAVNQLRLSDFL